MFIYLYMRENSYCIVYLASPKEKKIGCCEL